MTSPRLPPALLRELEDHLGSSAVVHDPDRLLVYESDGLPHFRQLPAAVVLPRDTAETAWVVERLHGAGVPLVPRGAGTGLAGGAVATPGAVLIGTARMRDILALDPVNRVARVQAGVLNVDLSLAAAPFGLHYAPDPSSQSACTLGGNVAANSGGPHCLKYGVTSRYVTGLTVVAADGRVARLGGVDSPPGLDWVGLFVGSEGCFGLATEIEVRLVPRTTAVRTLLAVFDTLEAAGTAVSAIIAGGLLPAALEILDGETITAVEESIFAAGYPRHANAVLVVEFDGLEVELDDDAARAARLCREAGALSVETAHEEADRARLWKGRKKAFGALGRLAPDILVQDATVPRSRLPSVLARISEIGRRHDIRIANFFHAGDGNLHPNLLFDRRVPDQVTRVEQASSEIMATCVDAGGTITGEHGVGLDKRNYMTLVHGPDELRAQRAVREAIDPRGLWNPGKVLPDGIDDLPGGSTGPASSEVPAGIQHYEPADLTLTAGAATPLAEIASRTKSEGQWLPLDAPGVAEATLGEVTAAGLKGTLWSVYGAFRDLVLGLTLVTHDGRVLRLGGRVVKNVAGFDLVRLVVGSGHAFGTLHSVTVRTCPRPAADRSWVARATNPEALVEAAEAVRTLSPSPAAVELGWGGGGAILLARALGSQPAVAAFADAVRAIPALTPVEAGADSALRAEARRGVRGPHPPRRIAGLPSRLGALLAEAGSGGSEGSRGGAGWAIVDAAELWVSGTGEPDRPTADAVVDGWRRGLARFFDPAGSTAP